MKKLSFRSRDMRTRTKISLIFVLLLVPIGYTVWTIAADKRALIAASEREQIGSAYIAAVRAAPFGGGARRQNRRRSRRRRDSVGYPEEDRRKPGTPRISG